MKKETFKASAAKIAEKGSLIVKISNYFSTSYYSNSYHAKQTTKWSGSVVEVTETRVYNRRDQFLTKINGRKQWFDRCLVNVVPQTTDVIIVDANAVVKAEEEAMPVLKDGAGVVIKENDKIFYSGQWGVVTKVSKKSVSVLWLNKYNNGHVSHVSNTIEMLVVPSLPDNIGLIEISVAQGNLEMYKEADRNDRAMWKKQEAEFAAARTAQAAKKKAVLAKLSKADRALIGV